MSRHFVLGHNGEPVEATADEWARWFEGHTNDRVLLRSNHGDVEVSTVFLGLDHQFDPDGPPLIYETMIFGGVYDGDQDRYSTEEEARDGHDAMVERVDLARAAAFAFQKVST